MRDTKQQLIAIGEGHKRHPSSWWDRPGRLRIELKKKDGTPTTTFTKVQIMEEIAKRIPGLPIRAQRLAAMEERRKMIEEHRKKNPVKQIKAKGKGKK